MAAFYDMYVFSWFSETITVKSLQPHELSQISLLGNLVNCFFFSRIGKLMESLTKRIPSAKVLNIWSRKFWELNFGANNQAKL